MYVPDAFCFAVSTLPLTPPPKGRRIRSRFIVNKLAYKAHVCLPFGGRGYGYSHQFKL